MILLIITKTHNENLNENSWRKLGIDTQRRVAWLGNVLWPTFAFTDVLSQITTIVTRQRGPHSPSHGPTVCMLEYDDVNEVGAELLNLMFHCSAANRLASISCLLGKFIKCKTLRYRVVYVYVSFLFTLSCHNRKKTTQRSLFGLGDRHIVVLYI